jgi:hypothetical protein
LSYTLSQKEKRNFNTLPFLLFLIVLLGIAVAPESSFAQQGFKFGRVEIHPGVALEAKYDSNVFLSSDKTFADGSRENAQEDFIYTTVPSLIIEQKRQKGDNFGFYLNYLGKDERFMDLNDQDFYNHDASGHVELGDSGGDINWLLGGRYLRARQPISIDFATTINPRAIRTLYEANSDLLWKLSHDVKAKIEGKYSHNLFSDDPQQNFDQVNGNGTIHWQTTALTGLGVNYSFRYIDYLETSLINFDNTMHSGSFIFKWKPFSVFTSEFWIGGNHFNVSGLEGQNRNDIIYKAQLKYLPNTTSSWTLSSFRELPQSYFLDIQSYLRTVGELTWDKKLGVKWKSKSMISFETREYDIAAQDITGGGSFKFRKDDYFTGLLSLTYSIQDWWDVIMEYSYSVNDSNFDEFDFSQNLVLLRFSFVL